MKKIRSSGRGLPPFWSNCFRIMKLTILFMMIGFIHVSASVYSQSTKLTIEMTNKKVIEVLEEIEKQSEFRFAYSTELIDVNRKVSVALDEKKIDEILDQIFTGTDVVYIMHDRHIMLYPKQIEDSVNSDSEQKKTISGKVTDSSGEPLPGVTVLIKGTVNGAVTNMDGLYSISNLSENSVLVFSFVGMMTEEVAVGGQSKIDIVMQADAIGIEEVVAIGYGTQRKADLTGAVASVKSDELADIPSTSVADVMRGRIAGVNVTAVNGKPGAGSDIKIRGITTINNSNPLIVIDGIPVEGAGMESLNPADIESIDVLKDASSAAIYGSRGANGVILVTTKRGKEGKSVIEFNTYYGWQSLASEMDVTTAEQFVTLQNEARTNSGLSLLFDQSPESYEKGTNWVDEFFVDGAPQQNYSVSFRGGNENISYFVSGGYLDQEGIAPNTGFKKLNLRSNIDAKVTDKLKIGNSLSLTRSNAYGKADGASTVFLMPPTVPLWDENGEPVQGKHAGEGTNLVHPIRNQQLDNLFTAQYRLLGNIYAEYQINDEIKLKASAGGDFINTRDFEFNEVFQYVGWENTVASLSDRRDELVNWNTDVLAYYNKTFNDVHTLNAMIGWTAQEISGDWMSGARNNFVSNSESQQVLNAGLSDQKNGGNKTVQSLTSFLGRVNYNFKNKYLLTANFRADGSSKFGSNNRWGYFPSFSGAWRISEEDFFNVGIINDLKLRGGWGTLGNDKITNYAYSSLLSLSNYWFVLGTDETRTTGAGATKLSNPDLKWETTIKTNLGVDIVLFDNKLAVNAEVYNHKTKDMLFELPIPQTVGLEPAVTNALEMKTKGLELIFNYHDKIGELSYNVGFNIGTSKNEVTDLGGEEYFAETLEWNGQYRHAIGQPAFSFYGYKMEGVFQSEADVASSPEQDGAVPGSIKFKDIDGDGAITSEDRTYLGSPVPDYNYGFNLDMKWKNFDFTMFWQGEVGKTQYTPVIRWGQPTLKWWYDNRWHGEGTSNTAPAVFWGSAPWHTMSDFLLQDVSYLRLKNLSVGYTFQIQNICKVRAYIAGQNLLTFTNDYVGSDPEMAGVAQYNHWDDEYPSAKIYTLGLNVTF